MLVGNMGHAKVPLIPILGLMTTVLTLIFEVVSTLTSQWHEVTDQGLLHTYGLWQNCVTGQSLLERGQTCSYEEMDWSVIQTHVKVAQFFMVLACVITTATILVLVCIFCGWLSTGKLKRSCIMVLLAGMSVAVGSGWYAARSYRQARESNTGFALGHSIIIAWVSVVFALIASQLLCCTSIQYNMPSSNKDGQII